MEIDFYKLETVTKFVELIVIVDCSVSNDIVLGRKEHKPLLYYEKEL